MIKKHLPDAPRNSSEGIGRNILEDNLAVILKNAAHFRNAVFPVRNVMNNAEIKYRIERATGEIESGCVHYVVGDRGVAVFSSCYLDHSRVEIDGIDPSRVEVFFQNPCPGAVAATDFQGTFDVPDRRHGAKDSHLVLFLDECPDRIVHENKLDLIELHVITYNTPVTRAVRRVAVDRRLVTLKKLLNTTCHC